MKNTESQQLLIMVTVAICTLDVLIYSMFFCTDVVDCLLCSIFALCLINSLQISFPSSPISMSQSHSCGLITVYLQIIYVYLMLTQWMRSALWARQAAFLSAPVAGSLACGRRIHGEEEGPKTGRTLLYMDNRSSSWSIPNWVALYKLDSPGAHEAKHSECAQFLNICSSEPCAFLKFLSKIAEENCLVFFTDSWICNATVNAGP